MVQAHTIHDVHLHQTPSPVQIVRAPIVDTRHGFGVGAVVEIGTAGYVVQDHHLVTEEFSSDGRTVHRQAPVALLDGSGFGWFRQVEDRYADPASGQPLAAEHDLARQLGFPKVLWFDRGSVTTLITSWPRESSGRVCDSLALRLDGTPVLDGRLRGMCTGLIGVCTAVARLHAAGRAHRALSPDTVIVRDDAGWVLRDLGLATEIVRPNEHAGDYQAPEQRRRGSTPPGTWTDVWQIAALCHVVLTGRTPNAGASLPVRAWQADAPSDLADVVDISLSPDPVRRPDIGTFARLVRQARDHIH